MSRSIVVVGGGAVGLSCAWALSADGFEVTLVEARTTGAGVSRGNAGWITPALSTPLAAPGTTTAGLRSALDPSGALVIRPRADAEWGRWLTRFTLNSRGSAYNRGVAALLGMVGRTWEALDAMRADGVEFEMHSDGLLVVDRDPHGLTSFERTFAEFTRHGYTGTFTWLSGSEARELEPALGSAVGAAMLSDLDRHVDPESYMAGLRQGIEARGVTVLEGRPVRSLSRAGAGWRVDADGLKLDAEQVVLATGLGTRKLVRPLGIGLDMIGAKGYSVDVMSAPPITRALYLYEPKIALTPLDGGRTRVGGFFEIGARSAAPDRDRALQLLTETAAVVDGFPTDLAPDDDGWAGLRPATPDSLPYVGEHPRARGVILAAGHGMLGITLAPATATGVRELASGARPGWLQPFRPDR